MLDKCGVLASIGGKEKRGQQGSVSPPDSGVCITNMGACQSSGSPEAHECSPSGRAG